MVEKLDEPNAPGGAADRPVVQVSCCHRRLLRAPLVEEIEAVIRQPAKASEVRKPQSQSNRSSLVS
jgi:hypothetical protein